MPQVLALSGEDVRRLLPMADCIDLMADVLEEITLFESLGLAVDDLAAASFVAEAARVSGRGALIVI